MAHEQMTIRWHNKPIDRLTAEELRVALVEALGHAIGRNREAGPSQGVCTTFALGMVAGAACCAVALMLA